MKKNLKFDKEQLSKIIELVNQAGVNLDSITKTILTEFKSKTLKSTAEFYKIAKKDQNGKKSISFIQNKIKPLWIGIVENSDKSVPDLRANLDKKDFNNYLFGIYTITHSTNIEKEGDQAFLIKSTLAEMFQQTAFIIVEKDKEAKKEFSKELQGELKLSNLTKENPLL